MALNPLQACNKTDFLYGNTGSPCPAGSGTQTYTESSVWNEYFKQALGTSTAHGTYYVALTPPVIEDSAVPQYLYMQHQGLKADQMVGLPATATEANFTPIITQDGLKQVAVLLLRFGVHDLPRGEGRGRGAGH